MVAFRAIVALFCLAAAVDATPNIGKPVTATSDSDLEIPTTTAADATTADATNVVAIASTTADAPQTSAVASGDAPSEPAATTEAESTTSIYTGHFVPLTPVVQSSQASLVVPSSSSSSVEVVITTSAEPSFVATTSEPVVVIPQTSAPAPSPSDAKPAWTPTTAVAESSQEQPTFSFAPASTQTSLVAAGPVIAVSVPSLALPSSSSIHFAFAGVTSAETEAPTQPAATISSAPLAPNNAQSESPIDNSTPSSSYAKIPAPAGTSVVPAGVTTPLPVGVTTPIAVGSSRIPAAITTPAAIPADAYPTTLATLASLSSIEVCPPDQSSCHTVVVTPLPATGTWAIGASASALASSSVSTDDGLLVFEGHTMSLAGVTLAAAPTGYAGGSVVGSNGAAAATGSDGSSGSTPQKGAASRMGLGIGGILGMFAGLALVV